MATHVQRDDRFNLCVAMKSYTAAVGRLDPALNAPYLMLEDMADVLAWKGMGAGAGGYVGIISRNPEATKEAIPWDILDWKIDYDGLVLTDDD